jgi:hypothetical protein
MKLNKTPNSPFARKCIDDLRRRTRVTNVRGDDDMAFSGHFLQYLKDHDIKYFFSGSKFTNKNRVIDRAIRTIKDGVGENRELLLLDRYVQQIVSYYNKTPHKAYDNKFSPNQVQNDRELEAWYIRKQTRKLQEIIIAQRRFMGYRRGNVLLVHLPLKKTNLGFKKRRRNFDELALFYDYHHGNARVELLNQQLGRELRGRLVTLPVYYTRFLAESEDELPHAYKIYFNQK